MSEGDDDENSPKTLCTAVLVGPRHILTASHCAVWGNLLDNNGPVEDLAFGPGYYEGDKCLYATVRVAGREMNHQITYF